MAAGRGRWQVRAFVHSLEPVLRPPSIPPILLPHSTLSLLVWFKLDLKPDSVVIRTYIEGREEWWR